MGNMAFRADSNRFLTRGMWPVAAKTGRDFPMLFMAGRTAEFAVNAWIGHQLFLLFLMTGQTWFCYPVWQFDVKGFMRIMAPETIFQGKMFLSLMTHTALGDGIG